MGARRPKLSIEEAQGAKEELFAEIEENVNDAILTSHTEDTILALLIEITTVALVENRPLFSNPLDEPIYYRRFFKKWVQDGLNEAVKLEINKEPPSLS